MIDKAIIQKVKAATVALGIRNKDEDAPIQIIGSGCIISTKGYLLTAKHVAIDCHKEYLKQVEQGNQKVRLAMYRKYESGFDITDIEKFSVFEWDPGASAESKNWILMRLAASLLNP